LVRVGGIGDGEFLGRWWVVVGVKREKRIFCGGGGGGEYKIPLEELYENSDYARSDSFI